MKLSFLSKADLFAKENLMNFIIKNSSFSIVRALMKQTVYTVFSVIKESIWTSKITVNLRRLTSTQTHFGITKY